MLLDTEARSSNFGTIPSLLWGTTPATESWWCDLPTREAFYQRAAKELIRMQYSKGARMVDALKVNLD